MSCGEKQAENFACNNKFEATAEQEHDKMTRQD